MEWLWSGWRLGQPKGVGSDGQPHANLEPMPGMSLFETIERSGLSDQKTYVLKRWDTTFAILNVYPYNPGHVMVLPFHAAPSISDLDQPVHDELWRSVRETTDVVKAVYKPTGLNIGINEGASGGGSQQDHLHVHIVPRWGSDTNFMTTTSDARILPETLRSSWDRLRRAWGLPVD